MRAMIFKAQVERMQNGPSTAVHCCYLLVLFLTTIHDPQEHSQFKNLSYSNPTGCQVTLTDKTAIQSMWFQSVINVTNVMPEGSRSLVKKMTISMQLEAVFFPQV
jgi:hypothetical protein